MRPASATNTFLQGLADRMLIDHEVGVLPANVLGNPDPAVADAEHHVAHLVDLPAAGGHNAASIAGTVLHRVLTKLADRHQDRIPDDRDIIELVDQRL